ncbi:Nudix hydrolase 23 chloroplastic, partial [Zea mays]
MVLAYNRHTATQHGSLFWRLSADWNRFKVGAGTVNGSYPKAWFSPFRRFCVW